MPAARQAALEGQWLSHYSVRATALTHQICPYYLSQELCRWADVVVCDYNYYFDMGGLLYGLTLLNEWRITLLVDEAHNLSMYTAELNQQRFEAVRRIAPSVMKAPLERISRHWRQLERDQEVAYQVYPTAPDLFVMALQKAVSTLTNHLSEQPAGNAIQHLRIQGKGGRLRYIPLQIDAAKCITLYLQNARDGADRSSFMFTSLRGRKSGQSLSADGIYKAVCHYAKLAGIDVTGLGVHGLRVTAATNALEHHADIAQGSTGLGTPASARPDSTIAAKIVRATRPHSKFNTNSENIWSWHKPPHS